MTRAVAGDPVIPAILRASGDFSATFKDPVSATWSATYEGGSKYFASGAKQLYVRLGWAQVKT